MAKLKLEIRTNPDTGKKEIRTLGSDHFWQVLDDETAKELATEISEAKEIV